jgi:hypothetical protein
LSTLDISKTGKPILAATLLCKTCH